MELADLGIKPPRSWYHNPSLQNSEGLTVAMCLAANKIIPDSLWHHDPSIKDKDGFPVSYYFS